MGPVMSQANNPAKQPLACLRCRQPMIYQGKRHFQAAEASAVFGGTLSVAVHACGACGHVELFLDPEAARASRE